MPDPLERIDLDAIAQRFDAYWRRETPSAPLVAITCPRDEREPEDYAVPQTARERWTDIEFQCNRARRRARNTLYLGAAFPMTLPNIGPDSFAAYLGGRLEFLDDTTSWVRPWLEDLEGWTPELDPQNQWWQFMGELIDALCEAAPGHFLVGIPDLHGGGDALSAARHPDRLALDLYDKPKEVKRVMRVLTDIYEDIFDDYHARISRVQPYCTTWVRALSRGTYTALQNDFSGLISPEMFEEFFLPEIRELAGYLDNSLYHLDGPGALGNLPALLEVEDLDGIQWVQGAAGGPMSDWVDLCRRILEAGKCLQIGCRPDELHHLLDCLPHEGLFITTGCGAEREARSLHRRV